MYLAVCGIDRIRTGTHNIICISALCAGDSAGILPVHSLLYQNPTLNGV